MGRAYSMSESKYGNSMKILARGPPSPNGRCAVLCVYRKGPAHNDVLRAGPRRGHLKNQLGASRVRNHPCHRVLRPYRQGMGANILDRRGWRAGQHVRLRVMSGEMGLFGWAVAHPFTIASTCEGENGQGLVLLVKKVGGWTTNLYAAAQQTGYHGMENAMGYNSAREMNVIVEGPYGMLLWLFSICVRDVI